MFCVCRTVGWGRKLLLRTSCARTCRAPGICAVPASTTGRTSKVRNGRPLNLAMRFGAMPGLTAKRSRITTVRLTMTV
jgi:hypothetical protein